MRANIFRRRHKIIFSIASINDMFSADKMSVMIIVPAGNSINDFIAFITNRPEHCIDQWPATGSNQDFTCAIIQALPSLL